MHVQQTLQARASVDLRGLGLLMAQNHLDQRQVGPCVMHQRRHRVTIDVARAGLVDAGRLDVAAAILGQRVGMKRFSCLGDEQGPLLLIEQQATACPLHVTGDPEQRSHSDRDVAVLASLALVDEQTPAFDLHVVEPQAAQFSPPDPRAVQGLEDRPVSQSQRCRRVGLRQDAFHFVFGKNRLGLPG